MKKERMTADNVEQLMEIVRALQQGEEPDPKKRKQNKKTEEPETSDPKALKYGKTEDGAEQKKTPASGRRAAAGKKSEVKRTAAADKKSAAGSKEKESRRKISGRLTDPDTNDEFERMLQEDGTEEEFERGREVVVAAATKAAGFLNGLKQKKKQRQKAQRISGSLHDEDAEVLEEFSEKPERVRSDDFKELIYDRPDASEETVYEGSDASEETVHGGSDASEETVHEGSDASEETVHEGSDASEETVHGGSDASEKQEYVRKTASEKTVHGRKDASEETVHEESDVSEKPERAGKDASENHLAGGSGEGKKRSKARADIKVHSKKKKAPKGMAVAGIQDFLKDLEQKGIHSKELVMLGAVALFALLLILIAVNVVRGSLDQKRKSKNVTADEGLVVTVEDEPDSWCASYPVKLKMYVKGEKITSVSINGESYEPDETGIITVNADDWLLNAEVKTENSTKNARIEIEYLDGDAPVLEIKNEENQIILTAVDARSSVAAVYYAVTEEDDYNQLPYYQKYSGAIPYEEGTVYRFYCRDKAGNCSAPVVTTLETAESFSLNRTEASLFPGESFGLGVTVEPEGALLGNLKYESMDEQVLSVEQNGKVTAVGNGTAAIRVTANGLESQICTVTVSNERTVTVSAIGDCTLGTDENFNTSTNFDAFYAVNGYSYFFQNVSSIFSQDDVTFANFEGTLTDSTARESKEYAFKGDPSYTEILKAGSVEVVTLANNHSRDYGEESLDDTEEALSAAGIDYCNGDEIAIRDVNGIKTAFIGIYVLDVGMERESQVKETIARAKKLGAELIITAFHWGSERENYPDETQTSLAHTAIDCGADLVVGHHPHVLQGIEKYNGKYIVYSLANFCFGGNSAPSDMDTIIFQQTFTVSTAGIEDTDDIRIIPCKISSASGYNNYQPTPATGTDAEQIMSRLNEYSAAYGQTYTAAELQ